MSEREPLRVIVVDDEPLARAVVREFLGSHADVTIVAECGNGFDAVKAVTELAPDLMLLDVQMPKLDGFEVLELLGRSVPVIFTTAYDKYALRAFEVHAVDYLLKPFSEERLAEALTRARARLAARASGEDTSDVDVEAFVSEARPRQGPLQRVLIRDGAQVHVIPVDRIDFVEAQDDYVSFVAEGKSFLKDQTMAAVEAALDPLRFVRIHRSYLSECRADRARRALRQGQPHRHTARRPQAAREPCRVSAPGEAPLAQQTGIKVEGLPAVTGVCGPRLTPLRPAC